jgi:hypothetical protein
LPLIAGLSEQRRLAVMASRPVGFDRSTMPPDLCRADRDLNGEVKAAIAQIDYDF